MHEAPVTNRVIAVQLDEPRLDADTDAQRPTRNRVEDGSPRHNVARQPFVGDDPDVFAVGSDPSRKTPRSARQSPFSGRRAARRTANADRAPDVAAATRGSGDWRDHAVACQRDPRTLHRPAPGWQANQKAPDCGASPTTHPASATFVKW